MSKPFDPDQPVANVSLTDANITRLSTSNYPTSYSPTTNPLTTNPPITDSTIHRLSAEQRYTKADVQMLGREPLYKGFFTLLRYRFRHRLFHGGMSGEVDREILERGHATVLLPYDPQRDQVVLIEQIRIAAYDSSPTPWLLELVAGMMEQGETAEQVARREAQEEAGLSVARIQPILNYLTSPGGTTERMSVLVGEVDASQAGGIHGLAQENEDILVRVVSRQQAYQWVTEGKIDNAASIIALQWLQLNYSSLRQQWLQVG